TAITAAHVPEPSKAGKPSSAKVTVTRDGSTGAAPTGTVVIKKADGTELGRGTLTDGSATIPLPATLPAGVNTLTAAYLGTDTLAPVSTTFVATVGKVISSRTIAKVSPKRPRFNHDFTVIGKVRTKGDLVPRSRVIFRIDGKKVGTRKLDDGRAVMTVRKNYRPGKHKLVVIYKGSKMVKRSKDTLTFRIRRA
ncbi:MAG: Ig-like domain-containing protein, partial [Terrabacter sp.]